MTDQTQQQTKAALEAGELLADSISVLSGRDLSKMTVAEFTTTLPNGNTITRCLPPPTFSSNIIRPYLYNITKCVRDIRDYKEYQVQYLESSGVKTIGPFLDGIELVNVTVSGPNNMKCVTDVILTLNNMIKGAATTSQGDTVVIDTGKLNEYTGGDIEPGQRKLVSIIYISQDITYVETKRTHTPVYMEVTMDVKTRDQYGPEILSSSGLPNPGLAKYTGLAGSEQLSQVYKINEGANFEESGGTYGDVTTRIMLQPTDTTNCLPGTNTKACP